jgi:U3 small nucleolar ribonucleoprotein protein IMP3
MLVQLKMSESVKQAVELVEQGHVRVGPTVVTDPAFFVHRNMEDYVTWRDTSKIRRKVLAYQDKVDDYDLLNA